MDGWGKLTGEEEDVEEADHGDDVTLMVFGGIYVLERI